MKYWTATDTKKGYVLNAFSYLGKWKRSFFHRKNCSNIYWKFHLVLNDVNSKSQVDKVDMAKFGYHGEWYTLLIIGIIDWNELGKFVYSSWYIRGQIGVKRFCEKSFMEPPDRKSTRLNPAIERSWARYPAEWMRSFFHRKNCSNIY